MNPSIHQFLSLDLPPLLTALFASVSCALLGNYLVLRKVSLMGDAISHAVLPGIVGAFLLTGSRSSVPVFIGAAIAGIVTALLVESIRVFGRLETGAAMGVVFSLLFALGVLLIEQAAARSVDIDADCLLNGQLETIFWFPPSTVSELLTLETFFKLPRELHTSLLVLIATAAFVIILYKELLLSAFDAQLSTALGFNARLLHFSLMIFVACAVVASFEAVGSILVIAMLICPAATARLLTDRMKTQLVLSVLFASIAAVGGYCLGAFAPFFFGLPNSLSAAGMMAVCAGGILAAAVFAAPEYGLIARLFKRFLLSVHVLREDLLGVLYRLRETDGEKPVLSIAEFAAASPSRFAARLALFQAGRRKEVRIRDGRISITPEGEACGRDLVRSHRLWESYLVERLGLRPDHVHPRATELEHFTSPTMRRALAEKVTGSEVDPHGKVIPGPGES